MRQMINDSQFVPPHLLKYFFSSYPTNGIHWPKIWRLSALQNLVSMLMLATMLPFLNIYLLNLEIMHPSTKYSLKFNIWLTYIREWDFCRNEHTSNWRMMHSSHICSWANPFFIGINTRLAFIRYGNIIFRFINHVL